MAQKDVRLNVHLPEDLHRQVKIRAAATGESLQALVVRVLTAEVQRPLKRRPSKGGGSR